MVDPFEDAVGRVLEGQKRHKNLLKRHELQLYGLYQQAIHGDNSTDRPRCPINIDGKAKWDAWTARRGVLNDVAKEEYIRLVNSILPIENIPASTWSRSNTQATRQLKRYKQSKSAPLPRVLGQIITYLGILVFFMSCIIWISNQINERCSSSSSISCALWIQSRHVRVSFGWISVGLALGSLLQTNLLKWNILSVLYIETSAAITTVTTAIMPPSPEIQLLEKLGLALGKVGLATEEHPVMTFSPKEGSSSIGSVRSVMEHPLDFVAGMHFRRFKEPLPDPAQPLLSEIELLEEIPLPKWNCIYRKRKLKIKNNAPSFLRRFASDEFFYLIEDSLYDKTNQVLYVRGRNESFAHLVLVEDFLHFQRHPDHAEWSQVTQSGACLIGSSFGFLRGTVESFVRDSYTKSVKRGQDHLVDRLNEDGSVE